MGSSDSPRPGSLWDFAIPFYARPGVEPLLLQLQDEDGLDIPLLLTLIYAGSRAIAMDGASLRTLMDRSAAWHSEAIMPLRQLRRALKTPPMMDAAAVTGLRDQVKGAELTAERLLLNALEEQLPAPSQATDAIRANIEAYEECVRPGLSQICRERLDWLLSLTR